MFGQKFNDQKLADDKTSQIKSNQNHDLNRIYVEFKIGVISNENLLHFRVRHCKYIVKCICMRDAEYEKLYIHNSASISCAHLCLNLYKSK